MKILQSKGNIKNMDMNRDFEKIKEAMELIKENDIVKYTELLIEYMKVDALYTINNSLVDIELNLRH